MTGELGAGKTYLTKGIVLGLGISAQVKSPTFVIINEYKGDVPVYHFDCYRLNGPNDLIKLGYEEYFYGNGITIVEWADKVKRLIPERSVNIKINIKGKNTRLFSITGLNMMGEKISLKSSIRMKHRQRIPITRSGIIITRISISYMP